MKNTTHYQISNRPMKKKKAPIKTYKDQTPENQISRNRKKLMCPNWYYLAWPVLYNNIPIFPNSSCLLRVSLGSPSISLGLKVMLLIRHSFSSSHSLFLFSISFKSLFLLSLSLLHGRKKHQKVGEAFWSGRIVGHFISTSWPSQVANPSKFHCYH